MNQLGGTASKIKSSAPENFYRDRNLKAAGKNLPAVGTVDSPS
jgi:hypothetical protein